MWFLYSFISLLIWNVTAHTVHYHLNITYGIKSGDCFSRPSVLINGGSPGPLLHFREGDHAMIHVHNQMENQSTTVHFHGISMIKSPYADGVPGVTQYAIPPNGTFIYEFDIPYGSAGTYFYHSHLGQQLSTEYGTIVVKEAKGKKSPYPVDGNIALMLADGFHATDDNMTASLLATHFSWIGEPQDLLMNGMTYAQCDQTKGNCKAGCHYESIKVQPGKTYRLRLIGATTLSYLAFGIADHNLTIIEIDGTYIEPIEVPYIEISSGQRYSVLLHTKTKKEGFKPYYFMEASSRWRPTVTTNYGILYYLTDQPQINESPTNSSDSPNLWQNGTFPSPTNSTIHHEVFGWISNSFKPLDLPEYGKAPTSSEVTTRIIMKMEQKHVNETGTKWFLNNLTELYEFSKDTPILVSMYQNTTHPSTFKDGTFDPNLNAWIVNPGSVVEIVFQGTIGVPGTADIHPMHKHGDKFWVVGMGQGTYDSNIVEKSLSNGSFIPHLRDTTLVYAGPGSSIYPVDHNLHQGDDSGWTVIRYKAESQGIWLIHCHTNSHAIMGMQSRILTYNGTLPPLPEKMASMYFKP